MALATLTNLTGTTAAATPLANDRALVNNMLLDLETTNNVTEKYSSFEVKSVYSAAEWTLVEALEGGGGGGASAALAGNLFIMTWKSPISFTLTEFRVTAKEIATGAGNAWSGTHKFTITLYKMDNRTSGGTSTSMAEVVLNSLGSPDVAATLSGGGNESLVHGSTPVVRVAIVKGGSPHLCDFQISIKGKVLHTDV
tara:strand:- start:716 stop:1306 length:591 start_codon:yes stop_codon:yes gene_type:complete